MTKVWIGIVSDGTNTWVARIFSSKSDAQNWKARKEYEELNWKFPDTYQIEEHDVE